MPYVRAEPVWQKSSEKDGNCGSLEFTNYSLK